MHMYFFFYSGHRFKNKIFSLLPTVKMTANYVEFGRLEELEAGLQQVLFI